MKETEEKIDVLYDELKEKVIAFVEDNQLEKGYIDTQLKKHIASFIEEYIEEK